MAKWIILAIILVTFTTNVHDPIHRHLFDIKEEQRTWYLVTYNAFYRILNLIMHFLFIFLHHFRLIQSRLWSWSFSLLGNELSFQKRKIMKNIWSNKWNSIQISSFRLVSSFYLLYLVWLFHFYPGVWFRHVIHGHFSLDILFHSYLQFLLL